MYYIHLYFNCNLIVLVMPKKLIKVFISYAHKDAPFFEVFKDGLKSQLNSSDKFDFTAWEDAEIPLGSNWDDTIKNNLGNANLAILCVSANFLNSSYIQENEFSVLINQYPDTVIVPVYFNHCNFNANKKLAAKQFFKPAGDEYNRADKEDFAFCDLIKFRETDGTAIPNSNIDLYINDFVKKLEFAFSASSKIIFPSNTAVTIPLADKKKEEIIYGQSKVQESFAPKEKKITDKIVEAAIIMAIVLSLGFIIYTLVFNPADSPDSKRFNSTIGCTMFFGSFASYVFNRKFQHN